MRRAIKSHGGAGAAVMDVANNAFGHGFSCGTPSARPTWLRDLVEHPRIGQRSYFPESEYQVLDSSIEGLEISIDDGAWRPCRRGDGYWSYEWTDYQLGRSQAVVRIRPRRKVDEPRQTCLFLVDLP